jgi:1-acyl-sn-glycerol-3-phosphate acyltransferase
VAPLSLILLPTRIIGKKNIKKLKKAGTIIAPNHQSGFDPVILKARVAPTCKLMGKDTMFKKALPRWILTKFGAYPVNRGGNDIKAVKTTLGYLKQNKKIVIFPEGTRVSTGELAELKHGLVMFALKTDCYVVPAVFRKKPKLFRFNRLLIDKPFKFSDYEEFKGVKINHDVLDKACQILTEKIQYLKDVDIKEFKKKLKSK